MYAYGLLFISAFIENIFPPIPGDTVTLVGAYFVGTGSLSFIGVLIGTTAGSVLGFLALFVLAARSSDFIMNKHRNKWIDPRKIVKVNNLFEKYGYWIILANRFLSGIRSVISLSAGLSKLNIIYVAALATISALIWNGTIIYLGAFIGKSWQEIQQFLDIYNQIVIGILLTIGVIASIIYFIRRNRKRASDSNQKTKTGQKK